jgi:hypothetical protein
LLSVKSNTFFFDANLVLKKTSSEILLEDEEEDPEDEEELLDLSSCAFGFFENKEKSFISVV